MLRRRQEAPVRAQRFPIHIPIRYRIPSSRDWLVACTENVSCSGVLFRTECAFDPTTTLDLRLELPPINNKHGIHGEVVCKGEVVRMEPTDGVGTSPTVGVAILNYRLAKKKQPN
jgi:hypothetical protein